MNNQPNIPQPPPLPQLLNTRGKKRSRNPDSWTENIIRKAKIHGEQHRSYNGDIIPAKQMQDLNCVCPVMCTTLFTQQQKDKIFLDFYSLENHTEQTIYLRGLIFATAGGRNQYFLNVNGHLARVCQFYFLGIHSIKKSRLRKKVNNREARPKDMRGKHDNRAKIQQTSINSIRTYLKGLEARDSHYSRSQNPNKNT